MTMEVDTGSSGPVRQPPRHMPFTARREVARQLKEMQANGISKPLGKSSCDGEEEGWH